MCYTMFEFAKYCNGSSRGFSTVCQKYKGIQYIIVIHYLMLVLDILVLQIYVEGTLPQAYQARSFPSLRLTVMKTINSLKVELVSQKLEKKGGRGRARKKYYIVEEYYGLRLKQLVCVLKQFKALGNVRFKYLC